MLVTMMLIESTLAFVSMSYILFITVKLLGKYLLIKKLHCPPGANFFLGHISLLRNMTDPSLSLSENVIRCVNKYYEIYRVKGISVMWVTWVPYIIVTNAKAVEEVLSSNKMLKKAPEYLYFEPWIGNGLLISEPKKWKQRRKMLTPTFHFRILEDFLKVMNEHSMVLVDIINERKEVVDLFNLIALTTLDTICDTSMGTNVHAQRNPKSQFVNAVLFVTESIFTRLVRVEYWTDFVFYKTTFGKRFRKECDVIHQFSRSVINKRRIEIINDGYVEGLKNNSDDALIFGSKKKKITFMDLLIQTHLDSAQEDGSYSFTISDVCEEVDTFMFEAFESTAAAVSWTLHLLGNHEHIQRMAYEEIESIFGTDTERYVTVDDLHQLKYVECCIKEALRIYPPVSYMGRRTTEDIDVCGQRIPSGLTVLIYVFGLHRDPKSFPQPNEYIPERFLEENVYRNPFAYIPFSAGPRGCIGQRFAMYELKTIVTNVLRNFHVRSVVPTKDIPVNIEIITRTKSNLHVFFENRF